MIFAAAGAGYRLLSAILSLAGEGAAPAKSGRVPVRLFRSRYGRGSPADFCLARLRGVT